jgi:ribosomal protein S27E
MTLKNLSEHNREKSLQWQWQSAVNSQLNGIACPECGQELLDTNPDQVLLTAPPQFRVHCSSCDYTGTRN